MATPSAVISATGIAIPQYDEVLTYFQNGYRTIYGQDVYIDPDSLDGQFLAIQADAINAVNQMAVATYNSFSPSTAKGAGLSSVVKINGLGRQAASNSSADLLISGTVGTVINNGIAGDEFGNQWALPASVTIGITGQVTATAICTVLGAINAPASSIDRIVTPTRGWQTVTNTNAAVPGNAVEEDATLRQRQNVSTGLPALSVFDSTVGSIANLPGVQRYKGYENDTDNFDTNGIPPHSVSFVVFGGDAQSIANVISLKKTPGTGTYGTTSEFVVDVKGIPNIINFFQLTVVPVKVQVTIMAGLGYTSSIGTQLKQAIADYISTLPIGSDVRVNKIYGPANLEDSLVADVYDVELIQIAKSADPYSPNNVIIAFNEAASCVAIDVDLIVNT